MASSFTLLKFFGVNGEESGMILREILRIRFNSNTKTIIVCVPVRKAVREYVVVTVRPRQRITRKVCQGRVMSPRLTYCQNRGAVPYAVGLWDHFGSESLRNPVGTDCLVDVCVTDADAKSNLSLSLFLHRIVSSISHHRTATAL
jgi:phosphatidylethanolamine-binding protein (PEBP) family uncharacterized protein